jgi:hypothetical protein
MSGPPVGKTPFEVIYVRSLLEIVAAGTNLDPSNLKKGDTTITMPMALPAKSSLPRQSDFSWSRVP